MGRTLGGIARVPQRWQRTPMSWPAPAFSKKPPPRSPVSHGRTGRPERCGVAAKRVGETDPGAVDLTRTGAPGAERRSRRSAPRRGADWMSSGLEPPHGSTGICRRRWSTPSRPRCRRCQAEEAEPLGGDDLGDGEAVVQLYHIDVEARGRPRRWPRPARVAGTRERSCCRSIKYPVRRGGRGQHQIGRARLARDLFGGQHDAAPPSVKRQQYRRALGVGDDGLTSTPARAR